MVWGTLYGVLVGLFMDVAVLARRQYSWQCFSLSRLLGLGFNEVFIGEMRRF
jgi:hypothetical protein